MIIYLVKCVEQYPAFFNKNTHSFSKGCGNTAWQGTLCTGKFAYGLEMDQTFLMDCDLFHHCVIENVFLICYTMYFLQSIAHKSKGKMSSKLHNPPRAS